MTQAKKNNSIVDFIIVGQGIAGSVLAMTLAKEGYAVCAIDQPTLSSSSKIAAGIWNPIVFKRLTKSWLADDLVPELISFYGDCEKKLNTKFIQHRAIIKPFTEEQEKILWLKKAHEGNVFLDKHVYENLKLDENYSVNSYSKVLHAGNLNVIHFIEEAKIFLKEEHTYLEEEFEYEELKINTDGINYKGMIAKRIIFCDGNLISKNPYFKWVPMKPAKGEVLTIHCPNLQLNNDIFNKGFFILPAGNDLYKIGATYEWENLNDVPTEKGKEELIKKINSVISSSYNIVTHHAGVRPSVIDRRPVVGVHPEFKNLFIFNGFGTKAVMLAPYFARQLVAHIKHHSMIDIEVDPKRFCK